MFKIIFATCMSFSVLANAESFFEKGSNERLATASNLEERLYAVFDQRFVKLDTLLELLKEKQSNSRTEILKVQTIVEIRMLQNKCINRIEKCLEGFENAKNNPDISHDRYSEIMLHEVKYLELIHKLLDDLKELEKSMDQ